MSVPKSKSCFGKMKQPNSSISYMTARTARAVEARSCEMFGRNYAMVGMEWAYKGLFEILRIIE